MVEGRMVEDLVDEILVMDEEVVENEEEGRGDEWFNRVEERMEE